MSSTIDIHIVNTPNLEKIENFLKDSMYRESIEFSANFNTRLCIERRLRLPFLDPQTGVAQNHSNLFMDKRQRMPGFRQGQIYTYPAARWRKSRRQYLNKMYRFPDRPFQSVRKDTETISSGTSTTAGAFGTTSSSSNPTTISAATVHVPLATAVVDNDFNGTLLEESSSLGGAGDTSDSKDSQQHLKEELPKEWFYDEMDINEMDSLEEPKSPADDEYDYDPRYGNKKRRKRRPGKKAMGTPTESGRKRHSAGGRGSGGGSSVGGVSGGDGVSGEGSSGRSSGNRGGGRGRRKPKESASSRVAANIPSPTSEPPSFEMAAAAVGSASGVPDIGADEHGELRNYRKYL